MNIEPLSSARSDTTASISLTELWKALSSEAGLEALAPVWITLQCALIGARGGLVLQRTQDGLIELASHGHYETPRLTDIATQTLDLKAPLHEGNGPVRFAHPIYVDRTTVIVAFEMASLGTNRIETVLSAVQWGTGWLAAALRRDQQTSGIQRNALVQDAHVNFAAVLEQPNVRSAALTLATRLASGTSYDRVSIGISRRKRIKLVAVSHSDDFSDKLDLNRHLSAAMAEAVDQNAALFFPPDEDDVLSTLAHGELAKVLGGAHVATIPFFAVDGSSGAITFERHRTQPFTLDDARALEFVTSLAGPALAEKSKSSRIWLLAGFDALSRQARRLLGPGYFGRKVLVLSAVALAFLGANWTMPYQVNATARVEAAHARNIAVPFDGFLRSAVPRPGDLVEKGQVIAELDTRELALERLRWVTEGRRIDVAYGRAIGAGDRAESEILRVQGDQAQAQIALLDNQIGRAELVAPFDGIVLVGDQQQNVGGAVRQGDLLFEIAQADAYRIDLFVDESAIKELRDGQNGNLTLTALPGQTFGVEIDRITPIAQASDGTNRFLVNALLQDASKALRPGMEGIAKIPIEDRLVARVWTQGLADWLRLRWWAWFG